jgi:hypothetical protein
MEEAIKVMLTPQQTAEIKKQIGFELGEIYLTKRSLNKLRVFRLRLNEEQQQILEEKLGQRVKELTVTRSVATRILRQTSGDGDDFCQSTKGGDCT